MIDCDKLSGQMPEVAHGQAEWSPAEAAHLLACTDCAGEWRIVRLGSTILDGYLLDTERVVRKVLAGLAAREHVVALPRLPWRNFALGLAAAASVALAVWVPGRAHQVPSVTLPTRIGPLLPSLSSVTSDVLDRISLAAEGRLGAGEPGAVAHLGELTEADLKQLSSLTENP